MCDGRVGHQKQYGAQEIPLALVGSSPGKHLLKLIPYSPPCGHRVLL